MDRARQLSFKTLKEYQKELDKINALLHRAERIKNKLHIRYSGKSGQGAIWELKQTKEFYETALRNHDKAMAGTTNTYPKDYYILREKVIYKIKDGYTPKDISKKAGLSESVIEQLVSGYRPTKGILNRAKEIHQRIAS